MLAVASFIVANLVIYWTTWDVIWKALIAMVLGFVLLGHRPHGQPVGVDPTSTGGGAPGCGHTLSGWRCSPTLGPTDFGGIGVIPFGWDIVVMAIFSVAIYYYAMSVRLTPEEVRGHVADAREEAEQRKKRSRSELQEGLRGAASPFAEPALLHFHAAPVGQEAGDRAGRGQKIRDAYVLVGGVRHVHVARAVHHAGHPAEADEEAHVRAVGDALDGGRLTRHLLVGLLYGLADRGVGLDFGGGELAAEPL